MYLSQLRRSRALRSVVRGIGVHRVTRLARVLQLPIRALVGLVLRLWPRDPRSVVVGAPLDRFADNAAYLFVYLARHRPELRVTWVTGSQETVERLRAAGMRAELRWGRRGIAECLRAGTYVYSGYRSDINWLLSSGAVAVGLWHGLPYKRVERGVLSRRPRTGRRGRLSGLGQEPPPDYLLSSTEHVTKVGLSPAFGVPRERCWELGYPRNDHLASGTPPAGPLVWHREHEHLRTARPVVGLFLTWRDNRVDDVADPDLIDRLAALCVRHGATLAYKAHYNVVGSSSPPNGVVIIPTDADLHAYLGLCDVLVTDYSSIALDFPLLRRPSVYYMPDLDDYAATRGFYIDPHSLPGAITRTPEELLARLSQVLATPPAWTEQDERFLELIWGTYDGHACAAIADRLVQLSQRQRGSRRAAGLAASRGG